MSRRRLPSLVVLALLLVSSLPISFAEPWNGGSPILSSGESGISGLSGDFGYVPFGHERVASRNHGTNVSSVSYDGANYVYSTPYGSYTWLQPGNILKFVNHYGEEVVSKSVYVLQYLSGQTWLPLIDFTGVASPIHNSTFYRLMYSVMDKKKVMGSVVIDFDCSDPLKPPKVSVSFTKSAQWNLGDFRWIWDVVPASNYRYYINDELTTNVNATYPDITTMTVPQSVGAKSKLYLGKDVTLNADGMWLSVGTEDYGATERQVGPEPFWNGKGTVSIFPVNAALIDPDIAYTEMIDTFTSFGSDGVWGNYDVTTNKGIPKGAIVEIAFCMEQTGTENTMGIRTDGSALNRYILIHEAEGGGQVLYTMPVKVHSTTGIIEAYHSDVSDLDNFRILGYFTNCDFTEAFGSNAVATINTWTDLDLGTHGGLVHSVILSSQEQDVGFTGGIRTNGGADLTRSLVIHEPEAGGESGFMFYVKSDVSDVIEYYISDTTTKLVYDLGYFDSAVDFVEDWAQFGVDASATWELKSSSIWTQVAPKYGSETYIRSLCVLNGEIYGGTGPNGNLLKWNGVNAWTQVAPIYGSETQIYSLCVLNGEIYGGTYPSGNLLKWNSVNAWTQVAPIYVSETQIPSLCVLNGEIYGGTAPNGNLLKSRFPITTNTFASFILCNGDGGAEYNVGARKSGSAISRYILVHESESAAGTEYNGYTVTVETGATAAVELYAGLNTAGYFMYAGYFKPTITNTAPVNDACDSTATFDYNVLGWINMTVTDVDLVANLYTVQITITTSDSKTSVYLWTQSTGVFSETSDPNGISSESGSVRVNIDTDTDKIAFKIKFTQVPALGNCNVQTITTDDATATDTDTYTAEFRLIFSYKAASKSLTFTKSATRLIEVTKTGAKSLTMGVSSTRLLTATRATTQSLSLASSVANLLERGRAATLALTMGLNSARGLIMDKAVNLAVALASSTARFGEYLRASTQAIALSSSAAKFIEITRAASQAIMGTFSAARGLDVGKAAAQSLTMTSAITRLIEVSLDTAQSITFSGAAGRLAEMLRGVTQGVTLTSGVGGLFEWMRAATTTLTFAPNAARLIEVLKAVSQAISTALSSDRLAEFTRIVSQGITWAGSTLAEFITGVTEYFRAATASFTFTNAAVRLVEIGKSASQSIIFSADAVRTFISSVTTSLGLTVTNTAARLLEAGKSASQALTLGNAADAFNEWVRGVSQILSLSPAATRLIEATRAAAQAIPFAANSLRGIIVEVSISLSITITQGGARLYEALRAATQGMTLNNAASYLGDYLRSAAQTLTLTSGSLTEFLAGLQEYLRDAALSLGAASSTMRLGEWLRSATQGLTFADATTKLIEVGKAASQNIGLTVAGARGIILDVATSVSLTLGNSAARLIEVGKVASQTIAATLSADRLAEFGRVATQGIMMNLYVSHLIEVLKNVTLNISVSLEGISAQIVSALVGLSISITNGAGKLIEVGRSATQGIVTILSGGRLIEALRDATQGFTVANAASVFSEFTRAAAQGITWLSDATRSVIVVAINYTRAAAQTIAISLAAAKGLDVYKAASLALMLSSGALGVFNFVVSRAASVMLNLIVSGDPWLGAVGGGLPYWLIIVVVAGVVFILLARRR